MKGFTKFLKEQGVVGFAVGLIMGGAVATLVTSFITGIMGPIIGGLLGDSKLSELSSNVGDIELMWGLFVQALLDFVTVAGVIYFGLKWTKLDRLDAKKDK